MSFRIEEKIVLSNNFFIEIKKFLKSNNYKTLFPNRKIFSIYFDTLNFDMYLDSEEGTLPRKKIRLRSYPLKENLDWKLETKINSVEGKYKISKEIKNIDFNNFITRGIFDNQYGSCEPKISISYTREYWSMDSTRITIDYNLKFNSIYKNNFSFEDKNLVIIELKANKNLNKTIDFFNKIIPYQRQRFSKYCEGINKLYKINELKKSV